MSYILDALRKADAQRERDPARGIHAQPAPLATDAQSALPNRLWTVLAVALVAGLAAAWWGWPQSADRPGQVAPVAVVAPRAPEAAPVIQPPPPPVAVAVREPAEPRPVPVAKAPPAVASVAPPPPAVAAPAPAPAAADRIVTFAELPPDIQQGLPKLAISGGVFSENAAQRMLIVGGQVANEGAEIAPGLVLEQIRAKSAVLRFRGWRYSVAW